MTGQAKKIIAVGERPSFLSRLTPKAIKRLRHVIQLEQLRMGFPKSFVESNENIRQCDMQIEILGEETAEKMVMIHRKTGLID